MIFATAPTSTLVSAFAIVVMAVFAASDTLADPHSTAPASPKSGPGQSFRDADHTDPKITFDQKGLTVQSPDRKLELNLGGRLHLDAGGGEGQGTELDETSLWRGRVRRARGELSLRYDERWSFGFEADAADRRETIKDLALGYSIGPFLLTVGNFKEPFSFERLQSDNNITFLERSLVNDLAPSRNVGAALGAHGERWTAAVGVYGGNINDEVGREGTSVTGRVTYAPLLEDEGRRVFHVGLSGSHRERNRQVGFAIEPTPESKVYDVALIGFDPLHDVRGLTRGGIEAAFQSGPFRLQAEYLVARAERDGFSAERERRRDAVFHGGYVQAAYVLTGQSRPYELAPDAKYGASYAVFGGLKLDDKDRVSRGGWGAWELAARYSYLDLDTAGLDGGRQHNTTVGLNWYPETNVRVMTNWVHAHATDLKPEDEKRRGHARVDVDIVQVRLQIAY
jgi:phosphate-selective porin OprO/OprP